MRKGVPDPGPQFRWPPTTGRRCPVVPPGAVRGLLLLGFFLVAGCGPRVAPVLEEPPTSTVVTTAGPNNSMIHAARVEGGVIVIDLGWWGSDDALMQGLDELGAGPEDVRAVFITHAHRDHLGAWELVGHAPFYMAEEEEPLFFGDDRPGGWIPRWADRIRGRHLPEREEVEVRTFASDTTIHVGEEPIRAFKVPGHTPGSTAYLFRETLFAGDAVAHSSLGGFQPARRGFSDDVTEARRSLAELRERLEGYPVRYICTAHAQCTELDDDFWDDALGG